MSTFGSYTGNNQKRNGNVQRVTFNEPKANNQPKANMGFNEPQSPKNNRGFNPPKANNEAKGFNQPQSPKNNRGFNPPKANNEAKGFNPPQSPKNNRGFNEPKANNGTSAFDTKDMPLLPSSFYSVPQNAVKNISTVASNVATNATNIVNNAAKSVSTNFTNAMNSPMMKNITEPIAESINLSMNKNDNSAISIPIIIALGVFILALTLIMIFREQISFGLEVAWVKLKDVFTPSTPVPMPVPNVKDPPIDYAAINSQLPSKKQVFNVSMNKYKYSDAEPLCKSFGAELATYEQVKDAWKNGADWCNYGWVKGQSAIYPTQEATYAKLQNGPEEERTACGIPGINGGYFDNPDLRFGVNCYGAKPNENDTDMRNAEKMKHSLTPGGLEYDRKVQDYKTHRYEIPLNAYNPTSWSA